MPWRAFGGEWSYLQPTEEDVVAGRASLHDKFWKSPDDWGLGELESSQPMAVDEREDGRI